MQNLLQKFSALNMTSIIRCLSLFGNEAQLFILIRCDIIQDVITESLLMKRKNNVEPQLHLLNISDM